jgi:acetyl-CoA carboxylase biotin carboxylase subunit
VDSHGYAGYVIPHYYDSLLAKLVVHAATRDEAIERMKRALDEFIIEGVTTTIPFFGKLLENRDFCSGNVHTGYVEEILARSERSGA